MADLSSSESHKRGTFIVIEGLDRSGKTTQAERLAARLARDGRKVNPMRFPDRTTPIGQTINSYLTSTTHLPDHAIHLLFSANRWEFASTILSLIASGTTIICDRYFHSGMIYSLAKGNPTLGPTWARAPDIGLPKPDVVIYLDIEPEKAKERGGYGEEVYEKVELQERVRRWFLTAMMHSGSFAGGDVMMRVDAGDSLEKVEEEVWDCVVECERMFKKEKLGEVGPWRISDELLEMTFNRPVEEILK